MLTKNIQSLGGKATAKILREQALENYYENPQVCLQCTKIITVPENRKCGEIRKKKFCNKSCAASYNNKNLNRHSNNIKIKTKTKEIKKSYLENLTKGELFEKCSAWQNARSIIQKNARNIYKQSNKPKECHICGYNVHYEVCHKKSVSSFGNEALILTEINNIDNLEALCPNHHWEFDNGIIKIN